MTNQASEDIVDSILSTLGIVDRKSGNRPGQIEVVKQIIRTEKLKLLAEVREQKLWVDISDDKSKTTKWRTEAVPVDALNKLEAEL